MESPPLERPPRTPPGGVLIIVRAGSRHARKRKTHCQRGHPLAPPNLGHEPCFKLLVSGERRRYVSQRCKTCARIDAAVKYYFKTRTAKGKVAIDVDAIERFTERKARREGMIP